MIAQGRLCSFQWILSWPAWFSNLYVELLSHLRASLVRCAQDLTGGLLAAETFSSNSVLEAIRWSGYWKWRKPAVSCNPEYPQSYRRVTYENCMITF